MQQTWAYRTDAKTFTQVANNVFATSAKEMWVKSRASYHSVAKELGITLFPVGDAFWKVNSTKKTAYKTDASFDFANPVYPNLPDQTNSLHAGYRYDNSKKLAFDANHANEAGCYLGGLVWYSVLFGESVKALKFKPEQVSDDFGKVLRSTADKVVKASK